MIDDSIVDNLSDKFMKELAKGNLVEAEKVIEKLEKLGKDHENDSLGTVISYTVDGMKIVLNGRT